jgi:hypothetical protein
MLIKPSELVLRELGRLRESEVVVWLRGSLERTREGNDYREGPELYREQGQAQVFSQILKFVDGSEKLLDNFTRNENSDPSSKE